MYTCGSCGRRILLGGGKKGMDPVHILSQLGVRCTECLHQRGPDEEPPREPSKTRGAATKARWDAMTPEQRWQAAHRLYWTMRRHKAAFIQSQHPDWPEARVEAEVRDVFAHART